jgi:hypothetical protein
VIVLIVLSVVATCAAEGEKGMTLFR